MIYPAGTSLPSPILFALLPRTTVTSPFPLSPHGIVLRAALWPLSLLSPVSPPEESFRESRAFDLRSSAASSTGVRNEGEKEETERRGQGGSGGSSCRLFRVTFDGRLVIRLNLRYDLRIEYIAPTIPTPRASSYRDGEEGAFEGREGGKKRANF